MNNAASEATRPVHTARYGSIKGAVWKNMVDSGNASRAMYNVTFSRSYRDGDDWKGLDKLRRRRPSDSRQGRKRVSQLDPRTAFSRLVGSRLNSTTRLTGDSRVFQDVFFVTQMFFA